MGTEGIEDVINLELALLTPDVRRSPARLEELLDPDFHEIGASGRLWNRSEIVAALSAEGDAVGGPVLAVDLIAKTVGSGLVLLTYVSDPNGRAARRSSLWRRSGPAWRLLHHQGTLLSGD